MCQNWFKHRAFLLKNSYRRLSDCVADSNCAELMLLTVFVVFVTQLLNKSSHITDSLTVCKADGHYLADMAVLITNEWQDLWHVSGGLHPVQIFSVHVTRSGVQVSFDPDLFKKASHVACNTWSEKWYSRLNCLEVRSALAQKSGILKLD